MPGRPGLCSRRACCRRSGRDQARRQGRLIEVALPPGRPHLLISFGGGGVSDLRQAKFRCPTAPAACLSAVLHSPRARSARCTPFALSVLAARTTNRGADCHLHYYPRAKRKCHSRRACAARPRSLSGGSPRVTLERAQRRQPRQPRQRLFGANSPRARVGLMNFVNFRGPARSSFE